MWTGVGSDTEPDEATPPPSPPSPIADPEVWMDYWSDELLTLWHMLQDQCHAYGYAILDRCGFAAFTHFAYENSSKLPPPPS